MPYETVELRIVDDAGRPRPAGETGELWIRSPAVMEGYLEAHEETRAVLVDGWFRTGDLATVSAEGFVTIAGRQKELILRGGYSVVPAEVEAVLLTHPAVAEAAVVGVPHPDLGEEVGGSRGADCPLPRGPGGLQVPSAPDGGPRAPQERDRQDTQGPALALRSTRSHLFP